MTDSSGEQADETARADGAGPEAQTEPGPEAPAGAETGSHVEGVARAPRHAPPPAKEFDWEGWLLVGLVVTCFLVVPALVLTLPEAHWLIGLLGLSVRQAYIAFPMIPALLLGGTAVWAAVRSRSNSS